MDRKSFCGNIQPCLCPSTFWFLRQKARWYRSYPLPGYFRFHSFKAGFPYTAEPVIIIRFCDAVAGAPADNTHASGAVLAFPDLGGPFLKPFDTYNRNLVYYLTSLHISRGTYYLPFTFRFAVTHDTLAIGCILPTTGRIRDFHPLERAPAGRTTKKAQFFFKESDFFYPLFTGFVGFPCPYLPGKETPLSARVIAPDAGDIAIAKMRPKSCLDTLYQIVVYSDTYLC